MLLRILMLVVSQMSSENCIKKHTGNQSWSKLKRYPFDIINFFIKKLSMVFPASENNYVLNFKSVTECFRKKRKNIGKRRFLILMHERMNYRNVSLKNEITNLPDILK